MFGVNFKAAREVAGFTQEQLADKAQVSLASVVELEQAATMACAGGVTTSDIVYLALELNLDVCNIFNGEFKPARTVVLV